MSEITFGTVGLGRVPPQEEPEAAAWVEQLGFDEVWFGDHLAGINPEANCGNPWLTMAACIMKTKRLRFSSQCTDPNRRNPAVLAQILIQLDHLSGGRIEMGMGIGEAMNHIPYGYKMPEDALQPLKETFEILRLFWKGEMFDYRGKYYNMYKAYLRPTPLQKPGIPLYIAGAPLTARKLMGTHGDGWINIITTPELLKKELQDVYKAASGAGRRPEDFRIIWYAYGGIADTYDEALNNMLEPTKITWVGKPFQVKRLGYDITRECEWWHGLRSWPRTKEEWDKYVALAKAVPVEAIKKSTLIGTPQDWIGRMEEYIDAGVQHFSIIFLGPSWKRSVELFAKKVMPHFRKNK